MALQRQRLGACDNILIKFSVCLGQVFIEARQKKSPGLRISQAVDKLQKNQKPFAIRLESDCLQFVKV